MAKKPKPKPKGKPKPKPKTGPTVPKSPRREPGGMGPVPGNASPFSGM